MNATNYYVSTTRLVLQADPDSPPSWQDLYTALPTLRCCPSHRFRVQTDLVWNKESTLVLIRNSLSCTVCENLLSEPYTPEVQEPLMILQVVTKLLFSGDHLWAPCVQKLQRGGEKVEAHMQLVSRWTFVVGIFKQREFVSRCKDYSKYSENVQLRILLENYKKLCGLIKITRMYCKDRTLAPEHITCVHCRAHIEKSGAGAYYQRYHSWKRGRKDTKVPFSHVHVTNVALFRPLLVENVRPTPVKENPPLAKVWNSASSRG